LKQRLELHRAGKGSKFVKKYQVTRLVYVETFEDSVETIRREKQLKKWNREWKIKLIEQDNLDCNDLSALPT
jgi:putative endonuclease